MLKPFCDKDLITHRQDGIALVARLANRDFIGTPLFLSAREISTFSLKLIFHSVYPHTVLSVFTSSLLRLAAISYSSIFFFFSNLFLHHFS